jgi:hypothetical protein
MYLIINNTTKINSTFVGGFPDEIITQKLVNNEDIIVISFYSNTIKVPTLTGEYDRENEPIIDWKEYKIPTTKFALMFPKTIKV